MNESKGKGFCLFRSRGESKLCLLDKDYVYPFILFSFGCLSVCIVHIQPWPRDGTFGWDGSICTASLWKAKKKSCTTANGGYKRPFRRGKKFLLNSGTKQKRCRMMRRTMTRRPASGETTRMTSTPRRGCGTRRSAWLPPGTRRRGWKRSRKKLD